MVRNLPVRRVRYFIQHIRTNSFTTGAFSTLLTVRVIFTRQQSLIKQRFPNGRGLTRRHTIMANIELTISRLGPPTRTFLTRNAHHYDTNNTHTGSRRRSLVINQQHIHISRQLVISPSLILTGFR